MIIRGERYGRAARWAPPKILKIRSEINKHKLFIFQDRPFTGEYRVIPRGNTKEEQEKYLINKERLQIFQFLMGSWVPNRPLPELWDEDRFIHIPTGYMFTPIMIAGSVPYTQITNNWTHKLFKGKCNRSAKQLRNGKMFYSYYYLYIRLC
jgi:hypothetical protein